MTYYEDRYKVDKAAMIHREATQVDDIIRLFSISAIGYNHDDLLSLGQGKNITREEADGSLNCKHSIFAR